MTNFVCPCCSTEAERLLGLVDRLGPRSHVTRVEGDVTAAHVALIRLALDFSRKPKVFQMRAIVEDWDRDQIVREVY